MALNWDVSKEDLLKIRDVVKRAQEVIPGIPFGDAEMDLTATHLNGNPLDLDAMLTGRKFDLIHDICGIMYNLDRHTGKLLNCFFPRFSKKESREVDKGKIHVGDRIKVSTIYAGGKIRGWRVVTGFYDGRVTIRCNGTRDFIIRDHELLDHQPALCRAR